MAINWLVWVVSISFSFLVFVDKLEMAVESLLSLFKQPKIADKSPFNSEIIEYYEYYYW